MQNSINWSILVAGYLPMRDRGRGRLERERTTEYEDYEPNGHNGMHYSSSQYHVPRAQTSRQQRQPLYYQSSDGSDIDNFQLSPPEEVDPSFLDNEYHLPFPHLYVSSRRSVRHWLKLYPYPVFLPSPSWNSFWGLSNYILKAVLFTFFLNNRKSDVDTVKLSLNRSRRSALRVYIEQSWSPTHSDRVVTWGGQACTPSFWNVDKSVVLICQLAR